MKKVLIILAALAWPVMPAVAASKIKLPVPITASKIKLPVPLTGVDFDPLGLFSTKATSPVNTNLTNAIGAIQSFTVADLQAALADANAQTPPDTVAAGCYTALIPVVQASVTNPLPQTKGLFILIQKARDLADNGTALLTIVQTGPINTACAPLVLSTTQTLIGLQARGAAAAAAVALIIPK